MTLCKVEAEELRVQYSGERDEPCSNAHDCIDSQLRAMRTHMRGIRRRGMASRIDALYRPAIFRIQTVQYDDAVDRQIESRYLFVGRRARSFKRHDFEVGTRRGGCRLRLLRPI